MFQNHFSFVYSDADIILWNCIFVPATAGQNVLVILKELRPMIHCFTVLRV